MRAVKETVRKYYKYGVQANGTIIGSPTIANGVISNFSSSNRLNLPNIFSPGSSNWEICFKITTGSDVNTHQRLLTDLISGVSEIEFDIINNRFRLESSCSFITGTYAVLPNTTYCVKIYWLGAQIKVDYSLDGTNYINDIVHSRSAVSSNILFVLGVDYNGSTYQQPFLGSIDLKESYIKIDGQNTMPLGYWWHGTLPEECLQAESKWYEDKAVCRVPPPSIKRTYYKQIISAYEQPTLTSNTGGPVEIYQQISPGGIIYTDAYTGFYPNTGEYTVYGNEFQIISQLCFKFSSPAKITKMSFTVVSGPYSIGNFYQGYLFKANSLQGTDVQLAYVDYVAEGTDYTFDLSGNTESSTYYTFQYRNGGSAYNDMVVLSNIRFYGEWVTTIPGTPSDYTYYIDTPTYYAFKE